MKKANKFPYKRVKIYWVDIVSNSEWMSLDKAKDQIYSWCEDTGYLLYKDQKRLIIFASHSFDDDGTLTVGNTTVYPRSVVKKNRSIEMTYEGIFDETDCKQELKRAKKYIKKQADIILALEKEI